MVNEENMNVDIENQESFEKKKKIAIICVSVAIVFITLIAGLFFAKKNKENKNNNTAGEVVNQKNNNENDNGQETKDEKKNEENEENEEGVIINGSDYFFEKKSGIVTANVLLVVVTVIFFFLWENDKVGKDYNVNGCGLKNKDKDNNNFDLKKENNNINFDRSLILKDLKKENNEKNEEDDDICLARCGKCCGVLCNAICGLPQEASEKGIKLEGLGIFAKENWFGFATLGALIIITLLVDLVLNHLLIGSISYFLSKDKNKKYLHTLIKMSLKKRIKLFSSYSKTKIVVLSLCYLFCAFVIAVIARMFNNMLVCRCCRKGGVIIEDHGKMCCCGYCGCECSKDNKKKDFANFANDDEEEEDNTNNNIIKKKNEKKTQKKEKTTKKKKKINNNKNDDDAEILTESD